MLRSGRIGLGLGFTVNLYCSFKTGYMSPSTNSTEQNEKEYKVISEYIENTEHYFDYNTENIT